MKRVRVDALASPGETLELGPEASKHLAQVLRVGPGTPLCIMDGRGHEAAAEVIAVQKRRVVVRQVQPALERRPAWQVHLLLGVPKGPAMDLAVRMATEAGVTHLHPVLTTRSVPKGGRAERWERIAESAAEQCGRADIPTVVEPVHLAVALERVAAVPRRLVAVPGAPRLAHAAGDAAVLIGPEGGLVELEVALAHEAGFTAMGLGAWTLRACTAAAVAVAMLAP